MNLKQMFLAAPEGQLDPNIKPLIEEWGDEPTALQILRVLDSVVHGGAASGFVVTALDNFMQIALAQEGLTFEDIVKQAHWRNESK